MAARRPFGLQTFRRQGPAPPAPAASAIVYSGTETRSRFSVSLHYGSKALPTADVPLCAVQQAQHGDSVGLYFGNEALPQPI